MRFEQTGHGKYATPCGRFDLLQSEFAGDWLVIDWDFGTTYRGRRTDCLAWAEERLAS